jgi:hypothetical protein
VDEEEIDNSTTFCAAEVVGNEEEEYCADGFFDKDVQTEWT